MKLARTKIEKWYNYEEGDCGNPINKLQYLSGVGIEEVDVVDLESAKYLKKLGYNKPTHYYWLDEELPFVNKGLKRVKLGDRKMNHNKYNEFIYSAPTKEEVTHWMNLK